MLQVSHAHGVHLTLLQVAEYVQYLYICRLSATHGPQLCQ
jgi:hypothetical protein